MLILCLMAFAQDPAAPVAAPPADDDDTPGMVVVIEGERIRLAREALDVKLREQGYTRPEHRGDYVVYKAKQSWKPQVWIHEDGWVSIKRQPPRVHPPGRDFADQGSPAEYLWCVLVPTACVSIGGWVVSDRKLARQEQIVYDATRKEVKNLNDAVARANLEKRLDVDIPRDLSTIWSDATRPAADRHLLLFTYWDTRTDTAEGRQARAAVEKFLVETVQTSAEPFSTSELDALNATRQSAAPLTFTPVVP